MKKIVRVLLGILIILVFLGVSFIFRFNKASTADEPNLVNGISIMIKYGTLTKKGASIIITDRTKGEEHTYGDSFRIEKKENGKWSELNTIIKDYGFNAIGYSVDKNYRLEMEINWAWLYGELEDGEYRLIKDFAITKNNNYRGSKEIYVEFTLA